MFIQDLLNYQGNDPSPQEVGVKYNIKVNFLHYYQLISQGHPTTVFWELI